METNSQHKWHFTKIGGVNRVVISSGDDLMHLHELDLKIWTALSCPVLDLEIDAATLKLIDTDSDGRIRVPEILDAVAWITSILKSPDVLLHPTPEFALDYINQETELGKLLHASATQILHNLDKSDATHITVNESSNTTAIFEKTKFNGDGVITADTSFKKEIQTLIEQIQSCGETALDRSGKQGITAEIIETFYDNCTNYLAWFSKAQDSKEIFSYGDDTENALQIVDSLKNKIDDYFLRCKLAEYDEAATPALHVMLSQIESITTKDLTSCVDEIAQYPLAKIEKDKPLSFDKGINPAWESQMKKLYDVVFSKKFPKKNTLSEQDWNALLDTFNAYREWKSQKVGEAVEHLGLETIKQIVADNKKEKLLDLAASDKKLEKEADAIFQVDKMVRFHRDLFYLLQNFVTFHDFYSSNGKAIFQAGRLFIDQRSCDLCIKVQDMPKHELMAGHSGMYLMYCDCVHKSTSETMKIVAAVTNGDVDNLMVGRNAIFYDNTGQDWDATVVKIIENPISIRQAFFSPYKKFARFIETQVNKFASSREDKVQSEATGKIEKTTEKAEQGDMLAQNTDPTKTAAQPFDIGKFVGIFAAIGLAIGAIGGVLASFIAGFMSLVWWKMPLALLGIILVISGPSMLIAWLKLRKRNIAPLLDANGWAINARALVNIPFGNTFTHLIKLPTLSKLDLHDPFKKKAMPLWRKIVIIIGIIAVAALILWYLGYLEKWGLM